MSKALIEQAEINRRIKQMEGMMMSAAHHPEWFERGMQPAAICWIDGQIAQLEAELLAMTENEKDRLRGRSINEGKVGILLTPTISHWQQNARW